jgi:hypothetical protein
MNMSNELLKGTANKALAQARGKNSVEPRGTGPSPSSHVVNESELCTCHCNACTRVKHFNLRSTLDVGRSTQLRALPTNGVDFHNDEKLATKNVESNNFELQNLMRVFNLYNPGGGLISYFCIFLKFLLILGPENGF